MKIFFAWWQSHSGATAIEYGLIAGGVALVIMVAVLLIGGSLGDIFNTMNASIDTAADNL